MIIAIDGTVGSGKSTVARKIANKLGLIHLNSGSLFRSVAYLAMKKKFPSHYMIKFWMNLIMTALPNRFF